MFCKKQKSKDLNVGDNAPDFTLPSHSGEIVKLSDFRGKKWIVLYFYPKDNTYYCTVESSDFRDHYNDFKGLEAEIIGVSSDSTSSHADFASKYQLPFHLLSDQKNEIRQLYNVPATFGVIPGRVTFVIDKTGIIRHVFNSQFNPKSHVAQALDVLKGQNHH